MSLLSRRELIAAAAMAAPLTSLPLDAPRLMAGGDLLSRESARGYRDLLAAHENLCVVTGDVAVPATMLWRVRQEAVLIRELPIGALHSSDELYVRYHWPRNALVRHFGGLATEEMRGEPFAYNGSRAVAWRERYGRGSIVTLASLLGPHLLSGDREAVELVKQIATVRS